MKAPVLNQCVFLNYVHWFIFLLLTRTLNKRDRVREREGGFLNITARIKTHNTQGPVIWGAFIKE